MRQAFIGIQEAQVVLLPRWPEQIFLKARVCQENLSREGENPGATAFPPHMAHAPQGGQAGTCRYRRAGVPVRSIGVEFGFRVLSLTGLRVTRESTMNDCVEILNSIHVARIFHVGPCFDRLFRWTGSIGVPAGRVLALSWVDPETVPAERLRSDVRLELHSRQAPPFGIVMGPVDGCSA